MFRELSEQSNLHTEVQWVTWDPWCLLDWQDTGPASRMSPVHKTSSKGLLWIMLELYKEGVQAEKCPAQNDI